MGLINLQTNLKSLRYGKDRVYGGDSGQPYIQKDIPEQVGEFGFLNQDFVLRGGSKAVTDSALDVERLGKYFLDIRNPSGLLFIAKQNLLSRTAVKTQTSTGVVNGAGVYWNSIDEQRLAVGDTLKAVSGSNIVYLDVIEPPTNNQSLTVNFSSSQAKIK